MVADNGPLYAYVDIPLKYVYIFKKIQNSAVSSYNSHLQHEQCLYCISDQIDVILKRTKR